MLYTSIALVLVVGLLLVRAVIIWISHGDKYRFKSEDQPDSGLRYDDSDEECVETSRLLKKSSSFM